MFLAYLTMFHQMHRLHSIGLEIKENDFEQWVEKGVMKKLSSSALRYFTGFPWRTWGRPRKNSRHSDSQPLLELGPPEYGASRDVR